MFRKSLVAATCVAAALTLAGCSGTTTGTPAPSTNASSAAAFMTAGELANALSAATKDKKSATLAFTFGGGGQSVTGDGAYSLTGTDAALKMSMNLPGEGNVQVIVIGSDIYIQIPGNPTGKPWIKAAADPKDPIGGQFAGLGEQLDPSSQFKQLELGGELTGSAEDTVNGVPTTRYTIRLDTAKVAANATGDQKKQAEELAKSGVTSFDMQIWVDKDNLPVKIASDIPVQGQTTKIEMRYSGWGQPVDIKAPSPDQVGSLPG